MNVVSDEGRSENWVVLSGFGNNFRACSFSERENASLLMDKFLRFLAPSQVIVISTFKDRGGVKNYKLLIFSYLD